MEQKIMKVLAFLVFVMMTAIAANAATVLPVASEGKEILESVTPQKMGQILDSMNIRHKLVKEAGSIVIYHLTLGGRGLLNAHLLFRGEEKKGQYQTLVLFSGFADPIKLEFINKWNSGKSFSKAWLSKNGKARIESDLNLRGGVTTENIKEFIETFQMSLVYFIAEVMPTLKISPPSGK